MTVFEIKPLGWLKCTRLLLTLIIYGMLMGCSSKDSISATGRIHDNDGVYSAAKAKINVLYADVSPGGSIPFGQLVGSDRVNGEKPSYPVSVFDDSENSEAAFSGRIQIKGNADYIEHYRSFKITLDDDGEYLGQRVLLLYKCPEDPVKITMKLGMDLFSMYDDIVSTRTEFVRLYIRQSGSDYGEYTDYGLYTLAENPGGRYLRTHGLDRNGMLYEIKDFDLSYDTYINASPEEREEMLELKNGDEPEKLEKMLRAVSSSETREEFQDVFNTYFNEDNYLTFLAGNLLMKNERTTEDYMLYCPTGGDRWYFLPLPTSRLFHRETEYRRSTPPESFMGPGLLTGNTLHEKYFREAENREKFIKKAEHLLDVTDEDALRNILIRFKEILSEFIYTEPDALSLKFSPEETEERINSTYDSIKANYALMRDNESLPQAFRLLEPDGHTLYWTESASTEEITYHLSVCEDFSGETVLYETETSDTQALLPRELEGNLYVFLTAENSLGSQPVYSYVRYLDSVSWGVSLLTFTQQGISS